MTWQRARELFPERWLLFEAIKARTENRQRLVDEMAVIESYPDSGAAMCRYIELHREQPAHEFLIAHTSRETLEIQVRYWHGIRPE